MSHSFRLVTDVVVRYTHAGLHRWRWAGGTGQAVSNMKSVNLTVSFLLQAHFERNIVQDTIPLLDQCEDSKYVAHREPSPQVSLYDLPANKPYLASVHGSYDRPSRPSASDHSHMPVAETVAINVRLF